MGEIRKLMRKVARARGGVEGMRQVSRRHRRKGAPVVVERELPVLRRVESHGLLGKIRGMVRRVID